MQDSELCEDIKLGKLVGLLLYAKWIPLWSFRYVLAASVFVEDRGSEANGWLDRVQFRAEEVGDIRKAFVRGDIFKQRKADL